MAIRFRKFRIDQAKPGMVLGNDIISARGKVMLSANTMLTETMINRLACWGFNNIEVLEDDAMSEKLKSRRMAERLLLNNQYEQTVSVVRKAFEEMRQHKEVPMEQMEKLADDTLNTLVAAPGVLGYLHSLRSMDNYTFQHSVNVAVIVGVLGKWLGYDGEVLKNIVLAGLLHDVGKALVPLEILNKPAKLTKPEMEVMQRHCIFGFEMLRKAKVTSQEILAGVKQHHERLDGSGYPQGIKGSKILTCARIIAIADTYDAMTSDRVYQESMAPFGAIKTLFTDMFEKFDAAICTVFLNNLKDFFVGSIVKLTDGRLAEVIYMDWIAWDRVTVKTSDGEYIELNNRHDLDITRFYHV